MLTPLLNPILGVCLFSYLLGSIPFALIVSRAKGVDLRKVGSGNLGATNVYRAMGLGYALLVFGLDAIKGYIPVMIALNHFESPWVHILIGFCAIVGHSLSPFVKFKGGKGAATGLGVLLAISPDVCGLVFAVALILILAFRYVAPVTILCSVLTPILLWAFGYAQEYVAFVTLICLFIIYRHRSNIVRLFQGKENRI
ncbi:MAG: glycerol-3-phosphate 1-O-acyltransferase PlsY [Candidatus Margulisiibacteriota bacterium]